MNFKAYARISKEAIQALINKFSILIEQHILKNKSNTNNICKNNTSKFIPRFPHFNAGIENKEVNNDHINNETSNLVIDKHINEIMIDNYLLNKSSIKQYLFYYFIPEDVLGARRKIKYTDIANFCSISINQVKTNIKILEKLGLASAKKSGRGSVDIFIHHEKNQHKKKNKGYITLNRKLFNKILSIQSVNVLRITLATLLKFDFCNNSKLGKENKYSAHNLKKHLPEYISKSKRLFYNCVNDNKNLFKYINGNIVPNNIMKLKLKKLYCKDSLRTNFIRKDITHCKTKIHSLNKNLYASKSKVIKNTKDYMYAKIKSYIDNKKMCYSKKHSELLIELNSIKGVGLKYSKYINKISNKIKNEEDEILKSLSTCAIKFGLNNIYNALNLILNKHCNTNHNLILAFRGKKYLSTSNIKNTGAFVSAILNNNIEINGSLSLFNEQSLSTVNL